jgi:outer membrane protein OmpA-like peptidoglycan-associated protein
MVDLAAGGSADLVLQLRPIAKPADDVVVDKESNRIYLNRKIFFELDKDELKVESLAVLDRLVEVLLENPDIGRIRIEGHTDSQGNDQHNLELSKARAASVKAYLVKQGVPAERLDAEGYGETRLLQQGDSEEVHATNRRVEFHLLPAE